MAHSPLLAWTTVIAASLTVCSIADRVIRAAHTPRQLHQRCLILLRVREAVTRWEPICMHEVRIILTSCAPRAQHPSSLPSSSSSSCTATGVPTDNDAATPVRARSGIDCALSSTHANGVSCIHDEPTRCDTDSVTDACMPLAASSTARIHGIDWTFLRRMVRSRCPESACTALMRAWQLGSAIAAVPTRSSPPSFHSAAAASSCPPLKPVTRVCSVCEVDRALSTSSAAWANDLPLQSLIELSAMAHCVFTRQHAVPTRRWMTRSGRRSNRSASCSLMDCCGACGCGQPRRDADHSFWSRMWQYLLPRTPCHVCHATMDEMWLQRLDTVLRYLVCRRLAVMEEERSYVRHMSCALRDAHVPGESATEDAEDEICAEDTHGMRASYTNHRGGNRFCGSSYCHASLSDHDETNTSSCPILEKVSMGMDWSKCTRWLSRFGPYRRTASDTPEVHDEAWRAFGRPSWLLHRCTRADDRTDCPPVPPPPPPPPSSRFLCLPRSYFPTEAVLTHRAEEGWLRVLLEQDKGALAARWCSESASTLSHLGSCFAHHPAACGGGYPVSTNPSEPIGRGRHGGGDRETRVRRRTISGNRDYSGAKETDVCPVRCVRTDGTNTQSDTAHVGEGEDSRVGDEDYAVQRALVEAWFLRYGVPLMRRQRECAQSDTRHFFSRHVLAPCNRDENTTDHGSGSDDTHEDGMGRWSTPTLCVLVCLIQCAVRWACRQTGGSALCQVLTTRVSRACSTRAGGSRADTAAPLGDGEDGPTHGTASSADPNAHTSTQACNTTRADGACTKEPHDMQQPCHYYYYNSYARRRQCLLLLCAATQSLQVLLRMCCPSMTIHRAWVVCVRCVTAAEPRRFGVSVDAGGRDGVVSAHASAPDTIVGTDAQTWQWSEESSRTARLGIQQLVLSAISLTAVLLLQRVGRVWREELRADVSHSVSEELQGALERADEAFLHRVMSCTTLAEDAYSASGMRGVGRPAVHLGARQLPQTHSSHATPIYFSNNNTHTHDDGNASGCGSYFSARRGAHTAMQPEVLQQRAQRAGHQLLDLFDICVHHASMCGAGLVLLLYHRDMRVLLLSAAMHRRWRLTSRVAAGLRRAWMCVRHHWRCTTRYCLPYRYCQHDMGMCGNSGVVVFAEEDGNEGVYAYDEYDEDDIAVGVAVTDNTASPAMVHSLRRLLDTTALPCKADVGLCLLLEILCEDHALPDAQRVQLKLVLRGTQGSMHDKGDYDRGNRKDGSGDSCCCGCCKMSKSLPHPFLSLLVCSSVWSRRWLREGIRAFPDASIQNNVPAANTSTTSSARSASSRSTPLALLLHQRHVRLRKLYTAVLRHPYTRTCSAEVRGVRVVLHAMQLDVRCVWQLILCRSCTAPDLSSASSGPAEMPSVSHASYPGVHADDDGDGTSAEEQQLLDPEECDILHRPTSLAYLPVYDNVLSVFTLPARFVLRQLGLDSVVAYHTAARLHDSAMQQEQQEQRQQAGSFFSSSFLSLCGFSDVCCAALHDALHDSFVSCLDELSALSRSVVIFATLCFTVVIDTDAKSFSRCCYPSPSHAESTGDANTTETAATAGLCTRLVTPIMERCDWVCRHMRLGVRPVRLSASDLWAAVDRMEMYMRAIESSGMIVTVFTALTDDGGGGGPMMGYVGELRAVQQWCTKLPGTLGDGGTVSRTTALRRRRRAWRRVLQFDPLLSYSDTDRHRISDIHSTAAKPNVHDEVSHHRNTGRKRSEKGRVCDRATPAARWHFDEHNRIDGGLVVRQGIGLHAVNLIYPELSHVVQRCSPSQRGRQGSSSSGTYCTESESCHGAHSCCGYLNSRDKDEDSHVACPSNRYSHDGDIDASDGAVHTLHRTWQLTLDDCDMTFPANGMTALIGPTGAGKSSVFHLLHRRYDPLPWFDITWTSVASSSINSLSSAGVLPPTEMACRHERVHHFAPSAGRHDAVWTDALLECILRMQYVRNALPIHMASSSSLSSCCAVVNLANRDMRTDGADRESDPKDCARGTATLRIRRRSLLELDGVPLACFSVSYLRRWLTIHAQSSIMAQEASVLENIQWPQKQQREQHGSGVLVRSALPTPRDAVRAARLCQCLEFIYHTMSDTEEKHSDCRTDDACDMRRDEAIAAALARRNASALSGGEQQRVALARAVAAAVSRTRWEHLTYGCAAEPDAACRGCLLLDEPTSRLDMSNEAKVQTALEQMLGCTTGMTAVCASTTPADSSTTTATCTSAKSMTQCLPSYVKLMMIVIAHRMSTVRVASHMIVLEKGRVTMEGAPAEVCARNGFAHAQLALQSAQPATPTTQS